MAILLPDYLKPYKESYAAHGQLHSTTTKSGANMSSTGSFVTSKQGKVYYPADCSSVNRIKPENRVYYSSSAELIARGYTPSKTCK